VVGLDFRQVSDLLDGQMVLLACAAKLFGNGGHWRR